MGIKYFFKWFKDSFPKTVTKPFGREDQKLQDVLNTDVEQTFLLLLDLNGIIHTSCQKIYKYGSFEPKSLLKKSPPIVGGEKDLLVFEDVLNSINALVVKINPKEIVLCIDGVAPISKQIQQRQRRFLSQKTSGGFDSNCISPGTNFLYQLGLYLKSNLEKKLAEEWLEVTTIYFMDSLVPGEGEHKLFDFLRSNQTKISNAKISIVIVGNDADLIMLSLLISTLFFKENSIYILREDLTSKKSDYLLVNINQFKKNIFNFAMDKPRFKHYDFEFVVCDFVILCFLIGNDFLPQISLFNIYDGGLDLMMKYYFTTPGYVTYKPTVFKKKNFHPKIKINLKNLTGCFNHLINIIIPQAIQHYKTREYGYPNLLLDISSQKESSFLDITLHYLKSYSIHHNITKNLIHSYLEEIKWVFNYYAYGGFTVDWKMYYPSQFAPTPLDILNYLNNLKVRKNLFEHTNTNPNLLPFQIDPFYQLLCILPPHSADLLPKPLNKVLCEDLSHFHPLEINIDYQGKLNEWEGIPILPALNHDEIFQIYNDNIIHCSKKDLERNKCSNQLMISVE
ncbi:5'-3' Exoribonuclease 1 [Invertebrate iridescent virus 30]|uniref:5'-3' Exoribonuclease 1 n=1 Tax=Invertebrate iridescent virus 30 TaxID=345585 RepID=W8W1T0_9VIRU|nr:5'-3' Exoribonuclease 1 [Invertebrate iridescent virus 30]CCV02308.1 5'-3' Exoribonuclease 1 [Invertebrate iridescent virus 30]